MTDVPNPFQSPEAEAYTSDLPYQQAEHSGWMWILFSFNGRIPRRYYWGASVLVGVLFLAFMFGLMAVFGEGSDEVFNGMIFAFIPFVWCTLALRVKRWHDRDKRGWWILITLIPYLGSIWEFIECGCLRGTEGPNRFGSDPT
ncbi:MAG: DUF805 domain-containing protein [Planctomycetales bacterium]|nr:DUF805 domain-containing protein [Planctomycetales bacterium]